MRSLVNCSLARLLGLAWAVSLVAACSTEQVLLNAFDNRAYVADSLTRPLTVADAKNTFLIKSSRIFYPAGIPQDPAQLPDLNESQKETLRSLIEQSLARVQAANERHADLLARHMAGFRQPSPQPRLQLLNQAQAVAATDSSGLIVVDAKVVQAIYRSALLFVLVHEDKVGPEQERAAFERFGQLQQGLDGMSGVLPFSDLEGFWRGAHEVESKDPLASLMGGMFGVLETRMKDAGFIGQSRSLERSFLGALDFLIAHEVAHLSLGHFPATNQCSLAQQRELDADQDALLVNVLASYDKAPRVVLSLGTDGSINASGSGAQALLVEAPESHKQFFRHAYGMAGFHAALSAAPGCEYPGTEIRQELTERLGEPVNEMVRSARWAAGLRATGDRDILKALGPTPFDTYYEQKLADANRLWKQSADALAQATARTAALEKQRDGYQGRLDVLVRQKALLQDVFYVYYGEAP